MTRVSIPENSSSIKRILVRHHRRFSHNRRTQVIADRLITKIAECRLIDGRPCVDIGCGDMRIAGLVARAWPNITWRCMDVYTPSDTGSNWDKFETFDGKQINYTSDHFNVSLLVDVLHHSDDAPALLREAARVSSFVIVKDHFKYGLYSKIMLTAMDLFGNWGYDVKCTGNYFTQQSFKELCNACDLEIVDMEVGMKLYEELRALRILLRPEWHFMAVVRRRPVG